MASTLKKAPPVRLSRADKKIQRTEVMLEAAWTLFSEKGYEGTTMEDVAQQAGVSRYPVYYAFGDKQNLFFELWNKRVAGVLDLIDSKTRRGASLHDNLGAIAGWVAEEHRKNPHLVDGLFFTVQTIGLSRPDITKKLQVVSATINDRIAALIEGSTLENGQKLRATPLAVATQVVALVNGLANMRSAVRKVQINTEDLLATFMTMTVREKR